MQAIHAEALFASHLQPSDAPDACLVQQIIAETLHRFGRKGCAERVAQEFGDHPETAVSRMCWARAAVGEAFDHTGRFAARVPATVGRAA
jgi:hypothetical protein